MAENTKIEWADHTFNPWIGCQKVSPACDNCYAEAFMDKRLGQVQWGPHGERKRTVESNWRKPRSWNRKAAAAGRKDRVFCASLADVFDNAVPDTWRDDLWDLIRETPHLIWMILTKRPQNIHKMLPPATEDFDIRDILWLGTTTENQEAADKNIPALLSNPAAVHFISAEPLLGNIHLRRYLPGLDWVIVGGESGDNARPMHPEWARRIRDDCLSTDTAFHFKQWGAWSWIEDLNYADAAQLIVDRGGLRFEQHSCGRTAVRTGKKAAGRLLDGRTWDGMPS